MSSPIRITAVPKDPPDLDQFVAALLALAIARLEEHRAGAEHSPESDRAAGGDDA